MKHSEALVDSQWEPTAPAEPGPGHHCWLQAPPSASCLSCVGRGQGELHISGVEECVMNSKERVGPRISTKRCLFF